MELLSGLLRNSKRSNDVAMGQKMHVKYIQRIEDYLKKIFSGQTITWAAAFTVTLISVYVFLLAEWVFIITKPSFLSSVNLPEKITILLFAGSMISCICYLLLGFVFFLTSIFGSKLKLEFREGIKLALPAVTLACLGLLLIDNFTYTLFHFGISTGTAWVNPIYLVIFSFLVCVSYKTLAKWGRNLDHLKQFRKYQKWVIPALISITIGLFSVTYKTGSVDIPGMQDPFVADLSSRPNIILITGDGVDASHLSIYGYTRETTPNISRLAATSLVAENAFTNAGHTAGSLISIYTSKYPTSTRVLYPPDILKDADAYQHLPGLLNSMGYNTAEFTTPYFGDAYTLNLQSGFDLANGRVFTQSSVYTLFNQYFQTDEAYFLYELSNRIIDRLRDIFFVKSMSDQTGLIQGRAQRFDDKEKVDNILKLIAAKNQPFFIHLHWMGTHGPIYLPEQQVFSIGKDPASQALDDDDFYDDSLLDFDRGVGKILSRLAESGLDSNTVLVIGSDHNRGWVTMQKIPLIFHFPDTKYNGTRISNIQNLDIAPTLLDYLGVDQPVWMEGSSFLRGELPSRIIFSTGASIPDDSNSNEKVEYVKPPFYQFKFLGIIDCGIGYQLDLDTQKIITTNVIGYTGECVANPVSRDQVLELAKRLFLSEGYDVSSLGE